MAVKRASWIEKDVATRPETTVPVRPQSEVSREALEGAGVPVVASGIVVARFGLIDVATGLTNSQLYATVASGTPSGRQYSFVCPFRGSVAAITALTDANKTAGTMTLKVFKNGTDTGESLSFPNGVSKANKAFTAGAIPFVAGDTLDVRVTTSSLTPASSLDLDVALFLALSQDLASSTT